MKPKDEITPLNEQLLEEISIDELESRLELDAPKTCGQYTEAPKPTPSG